MSTSIDAENAQKRTMILGIDPGLTGALGIYCREKGRLLSAIDMPVVTLPRSKKLMIDAYEISQYISARRDFISHAAVEKVGSSPQMGVVSAFNFGFGAGILHGILYSLGIKIIYIDPATWKLAAGLIHASKSDSRALATELFPEMKERFRHKKDHGRAEAAILSFLGSRLDGAS